MCGTTETCPTPVAGQTPPAFSLTLGLPRVYHLSGPGLHVKVRAPPFGSWKVEVIGSTSNLQPLTSSIPEGAWLPKQDYAKPIPAPSPETARYWQGCRAHELWLPFCRSCGSFFFYPRRFCPQCFGWDVEWRRVSGRGRVYSYAIQYRAFHPGWSRETPYVTPPLPPPHSPPPPTTP